MCSVLVERPYTVTAGGVRDTPGFKEPKQESGMRDYTEQ